MGPGGKYFWFRSMCGSTGNICKCHKDLCTDPPSCHLHKTTIVLEKCAFLGSLKLGIGRVGSISTIHPINAAVLQQKADRQPQ